MFKRARKGEREGEREQKQSIRKGGRMMQKRHGGERGGRKQ